MGIKLGNICRFQSGGTPSKGKPEFFIGTIPWITTTALNGGNIGKESAIDWISEQAIKESAAKIVPAFSIMVGTRVGVGKVAINTMSMSTSQDIISLLDIDESIWSKAFLCKFLQAKGTFLNAQARGATIKGIKIDVLSELELPEIPIEEQQHISQIIDKVKTTIAIRQRQLQKLDELVKARFVELFGDLKSNPMEWPTKKLSELCDVGSSKRIYQNELSTEGIPFLRISDLNERIDNIENAPELFIPINRYNKLKENGLVPTAGDILVTSRGTLGRCYIVRPEDEFYFQDGMISWLSDLNNQITSLYLSQLFAMSEIQKQIANSQAGSTVAYLSISMLKKLNIMLPPLDLQNQFVAFVEQTDKSKIVVQKALDEAQLLFDSLMQQYFL